MELNDDLVPRGVPKQASFQETFGKPEVPEVSLIFDSKSPFDRNAETKTCEPTEEAAKKIPDLAPVSESYNVWRYKNAHLLNHVSSRSNSFQPAPLYDSAPEIRSTASSIPSENRPTYTSLKNGSVEVTPSSNGLGHWSKNGPTSNGVQSENRPPYQSENRPLYQSENGPPYQSENLLDRNGRLEGVPIQSHRRSENGTTFNGMHTESGPVFNGERQENGIQSNLIYSGNTRTQNDIAYENRHYFNASPESSKSQQNLQTYSSSNNLQTYNSADIRAPGFSPTETLRAQNNQPNYNFYPHSQHPSNHIQPVSNHGTILPAKSGQLALPCNYMSPQDQSYSNRVSAGEERLQRSPSSNTNGCQNGYQMNFVHFSRVTAPITSQSSDSRSNNLRSCQEVSSPPNHRDIHQSNGLSNPYQVNGYVSKYPDRKVSFEEPPKNTFHSVSPCKCDTCLQKMYIKTRQSPQNESQANRSASSPCSPSDRLRTKKVSTSDLFQIVVNQTEQLKLLQEKVDQLVSERTQAHSNCACMRESPPMRSIAIQANADEDLVQKSVGVMTSFYDRRTPSPRPLKTPPKTKDAEKNCSCTCGHQTPVWSSPDNKFGGQGDQGSGSRSKKNSPESLASSQDKNDVSLTLNAANLPPVLEQIPSPEPSVHVEMQDYHSSSDEDSIESVKPNTENLNQNGKPNGWTFYDNVIGQVNNILQNSQEAALHAQSAPKNPAGAIRQTTLEQLQKMGISVMDDKNLCDNRLGHEHIPNHFNQLPNQYNCRESDLSLHMNQLAMKYLNKDQFTNAVGIQQDIAVCNMNGATNLSFTTLRYLERYHLMPAEFKRDFALGGECHVQENFNHLHPPFENNHPYQMPPQLTNKVLDITALKQQPKLL